MKIELGIFQTVRETVDWLIEKYKAVTDSETKNQLSKIADQISILAANKAAYLVVLKNELNKNTEYVDLSRIHSALSTAEEDTQILRDLLDKFKLGSQEISFNLKHGLEKLTMLKRIKLNELKELILQDVLTIQEAEKIVSELESFEQKWIALGQEIDMAIR